MTSEMTELVVLMDQERNYYLVPRQVIEQARVPEEQRAAVEQELGDDATGFASDYLFDAKGKSRPPELAGLFATVGLIAVPPTQIQFGRPPADMQDFH